MHYNSGVGAAVSGVVVSACSCADMLRDLVYSQVLIGKGVVVYENICYQAAAFSCKYHFKADRQVIITERGAYVVQTVQ